MNEYYKMWLSKHPGYFKEYRERNREKMDNAKKKWIENNSLHNKIYQKEWRKGKKAEKMAAKIEVFKTYLQLQNSVEKIE